MLKKLKITNLAIIDSLEIDFSDSFNVITGESGSGKTIIYKSISYLFGNRFNKNDLRNGKKECQLSGFISFKGKDHHLSRIFTNTSTKNYINNNSVKLIEYKKFTHEIWESYGQHEQQSLIDENNHITYLDLFSKSKYIYEKYITLYVEYTSLINEISELTNSSNDYLRNRELYEFQFQELQSIDIQINEDFELQEKITSLKKNKSSNEILYKLSAINDRSSDTMKIINESIRLMSNISDSSASAKEMMVRLDQFISEFEDIKFEASKLMRDFYYNQNEIDQFSAKLISINELKRKYGGTIESIINEKNRLKLLLENSDGISTLIEKKISDKNTIEDKLNIIGLDLLCRREASAKELAIKIKDDLKIMGMDKIDFFIDLGRFELNKIAIEKCIFYIKTNQGEELTSLGKIVSGGELSRIMMAIKLSINSYSENKLFILDEIDAGLSGKEADSIGNIIRILSLKNQVVCITHLSQIASKADRHFKVYKKIVKDRTNCIIKALKNESKITELASMISGEEITAQSIDYAREILGK